MTPPIASRQGTSRPFTVVVCTGAGCTANQHLVMEELRGAIRRCRHGVLASTGCLLGPVTCAGRRAGPGALIVLQPCRADARTPLGRAHWIGPVGNAQDMRTVRDWLERGEWDIAALPARLRLETHLLAKRRQN